MLIIKCKIQNSFSKRMMFLITKTVMIWSYDLFNRNKNKETKTSARKGLYLSLKF